MIDFNDIQILNCTYGRNDDHKNEGQMYVCQVDELYHYCILGSKNYNITSEPLTDYMNMEQVMDIDGGTTNEPMFGRQQMADEVNSKIQYDLESM